MWFAYLPPHCEPHVSMPPQRMPQIDAESFFDPVHTRKMGHSPQEAAAEAIRKRDILRARLKEYIVDQLPGMLSKHSSVLATRRDFQGGCRLVFEMMQLQTITTHVAVQMLHIVGGALFPDLPTDCAVGGHAA